MKIINKIFLLFLIILFSACQNFQKKTLNAKELFEKTKSQAKRGYYIEALEGISKLKYQFPYSPYSVKADLLKADIAFDQGEWEQALKTYEIFSDLYPRHEKAPYAYFRQVLSWDRQVPKKAARDLSLAQGALKSADNFIKKYPQSPHIKEVKKIKKEILQRLEEKELHIAGFYLKKSRYKAALGRLQDLIKKNPSKKNLKTALTLALRAVRKENNKEMEKNILNKLKNL